MSEALHLEVGHFGVRVLVIEPGAIETRFGANVLDHRGEAGPYEELASLWQLAQAIRSAAEQALSQDTPARSQSGNSSSETSR